MTNPVYDNDPDILHQKQVILLPVYFTIAGSPLGRERVASFMDFLVSKIFSLENQTLVNSVLFVAKRKWFVSKTEIVVYRANHNEMWHLTFYSQINSILQEEAWKIFSSLLFSLSKLERFFPDQSK